MGGATLSPLRPGLHKIVKKFQMTSFTSLIPRLVISFCVTTDYWLPLIGLVERLQRPNAGRAGSGRAEQFLNSLASGPDH